jgi:hypothetical protein
VLYISANSNDITAGPSTSCVPNQEASDVTLYSSTSTSSASIRDFDTSCSVESRAGSHDQLPVTTVGSCLLLVHNNLIKPCSKKSAIYKLKTNAVLTSTPWFIIHIPHQRLKRRTKEDLIFQIIQPYQRALMTSLKKVTRVGIFRANIKD